MVESLTINPEAIAFHSGRDLNCGQFMNPGTIMWPLQPDVPSFGAVDVHIWAVSLDAPSDYIAHCASLLAPDESERAARLRFVVHRNRAVVGRSVLRSLLASYLRCRPEHLRFAYGPNGKPTLASPLDANRLHFNLAHSGDLALIAVTALGPLGVDVEQIRPMPDAEDLVERFFSPRENALFQQLRAQEKSSAFFNLWTRKEAWLKATGEGIGHSLNRVEVTFLPGEPAKLLGLPKDTSPSSNWTLQELAPAPGFVGAVALPNLPFSISHFQFAISQR